MWPGSRGSFNLSRDEFSSRLWSISACFVFCALSGGNLLFFLSTKAWKQRAMIRMDSPSVVGIWNSWFSLGELRKPEHWRELLRPVLDCWVSAYQVRRRGEHYKLKGPLVQRHRRAGVGMSLGCRKEVVRDEGLKEKSWRIFLCWREWSSWYNLRFNLQNMN